jgi:pre-mRNA-splicing factor CDC5/CEF1
MDDSLMKKDAEHHKLQAAHNAPAAVAKAMAMNDPTMQRKRGKMMLPAPQVSHKC